MSIRKVPFAIMEYYHVYSRGVEKRPVFKDNQDYQHFIFLLFTCNTERSIAVRDMGVNFDRGETIVDIGAYCLMPNHFHLLVREKIEKGTSTYIHKLLTAYSMYFNKKYKRTGTLFESRFKANHCDADRYLKYIFSYIHLNPAKLIDRDWKKKEMKNSTRLLKYVCSYPYSSFGEHASRGYRILNPDVFPPYFLSIQEHVNELFEWLDLTP